MNCKRSFWRTVLAPMFFGSAVWLSLNCHMPAKPFHELKTNEVEWTVYENTLLPYRLQYPIILDPSASQNGEVLFRYGMGVPVRVRYMDETEGELSEVQERILSSFALTDQGPLL